MGRPRGPNYRPRPDVSVGTAPGGNTVGFDEPADLPDEETTEDAGPGELDGIDTGIVETPELEPEGRVTVIAEEPMAVISIVPRKITKILEDAEFRLHLEGRGADAVAVQVAAVRLAEFRNALPAALAAADGEALEVLRFLAVSIL